MTNKPIVVFSDLDGTLLDHDTYSFEAALPAVKRLNQLGIPLILNSSKTRPEMEAIQQQLNNVAPFIVENGAALVVPVGCLGNKEEKVVYFAAPVSDVLMQLESLREEGFAFRGFQDMTVAELAGLTGLTEQQAALSRQRTATEPLLWLGSDEALVEFEQRLQQGGLQLVKGGRFYHAMGQYDKADAMHYLLKQYQIRYSEKEVLSIALGDSPNDLNMLEAADYAVVIRGVNSRQLKFTVGKMVIFSQGMGPVGWNGAMQPLLDQLTGRAPTID
ncbi:MAG: HAD-IIB family hydrolase [Ketobacter sp.]